MIGDVADEAPILYMLDSASTTKHPLNLFVKEDTTLTIVCHYSTYSTSRLLGDAPHSTRVFFFAPLGASRALRLFELGFERIVGVAVGRLPVPLYVHEDELLERRRRVVLPQRRAVVPLDVLAETLDYRLRGAP